VLLLRKPGRDGDRWVLPKGKRRRAEREVAAAVREVIEETGLKRGGVERFLPRERYFDDDGGSPSFKEVSYFLMRCTSRSHRPSVAKDEGFSAAGGGTFVEVLA